MGRNVGTPVYAAPEYEVSHNPVPPGLTKLYQYRFNCDTFSIGIVLLELFWTDRSIKLDLFLNRIHLFVNQPNVFDL